MARMKRLTVEDLWKLDRPAIFDNEVLLIDALMARTRTGRGQRVETSLLQATMSLLGENAARFFENGEVPARATRTRSSADHRADHMMWTTDPFLRT